MFILATHSCITHVFLVNSTTVKVKNCAPSVCPSGSINLGIGKGSFLCCSTDLCNAQDAPGIVLYFLSAVYKPFNKKKKVGWNFIYDK